MKYEIKGGNLPVVEITLESGETIITESGAMSWMSENLTMDTESGGAKKAFSRVFSGESLFLNKYTAEGGEGSIAFSSSFPGSILDVQLSRDKDLIIQKGAFLAAESSIDLSIFFQKKLGTALFGGEGLIMQRVSGDGLVFLEIDGSLIEKDLAPGEVMYIDNGYLAFMEDTVKFDIEKIKGLKNIFFGGEGLFVARVEGPGKIGLQTQPIIQHAGALIPYLPTKS